MEAGQPHLMTDRDPQTDMSTTAAALDLLRAAEAALAEGLLADGGGPVAELATLACRLVGTEQPTDRVASAYGLTDREREVLDLVARAFSAGQIAKALMLSRSTVAFHLGRIYAKTGTHSRYDLAGLVWGSRRLAA